IFEEPNIEEYKSTFASALPFKHICIDNFIDLSFVNSLHNHFPALGEMRKKYNGINEKKAEDAEFGQLHLDFTILKEQLQSEKIKRWIERITGINDLQTSNDQRGAGLHQGGQNSFLDIHIDFNVHPLLNLHRRLNLIIFLNPGWQDAWGGHLEFWNKDVSSCINKYLPIHNRCVIFETNEISYHGYSKINIPAGESRKSFYTYYYTSLSSGVKYHDTVFKTRPEETIFKAFTTKSKDLLKNTVKKTFKNLGIDTYFKKLE
ncbi:MAG TPA: 2OG-Fe(II) oxygenase, partial [Segetibacter sp.]